MDDASLLALYDFGARASYGPIEVALGKRRGEAAPCAEVLCVRVPERWTGADLDAYCRFHRSYVAHRAKHAWPHAFALVYDGRAASAPRDVPGMLAQAAGFVATHQSCGEQYKALLHKVALVVSDPALGSALERLIAPFEPTKPVVVHCAREKGASTLAAKLAG